MLVSDYFLSSIRGQLLFCCFLDLLTRSSLPPSNKSTVPRSCLLPAGELSLRRVFSFSASPESLLYQFHSFLLIIKEKNLTNLQTEKGEKISLHVYLTGMPSRHKQQRKRFHMNKPRSTLVFTNLPLDQCTF